MLEGRRRRCRRMGELRGRKNEERRRWGVGSRSVGIGRKKPKEKGK